MFWGKMPDQEILRTLLTTKSHNSASDAERHMGTKDLTLNHNAENLSTLLRIWPNCSIRSYFERGQMMVLVTWDENTIGHLSVTAS